MGQEAPAEKARPCQAAVRDLIEGVLSMRIAAVGVWFYF
jgi:hypothetical protein